MTTAHGWPVALNYLSALDSNSIDLDLHLPLIYVAEESLPLV